MSNFKKTKENLIYEWKQRKYNLSLFGKNAQSDWNYFLVFVLITLIMSAIGGTVNYIRIDREINKESEEVFFKSRKKDIEKVGELISELKLKKEVFDSAMQKK